MVEEVWVLDSGGEPTPQEALGAAAADWRRTRRMVEDPRNSERPATAALPASLPLSQDEARSPLTGQTARHAAIRPARMPTTSRPDRQRAGGVHTHRFRPGSPA